MLSYATVGKGIRKYILELRRPKLILWCYLIWYFAIVCQYFDPSPGLWLTSVGISAVIGFALNLAAAQNNQRLERWVVFRLYVFPFCVSSYSALIKGQGFFLLFPTDWKPLLVAILSCALFLGVIYLIQISLRKKQKNKE